VRPGAHIKAAIEVLSDVLERHRPAASALSDWGKSHRFAGSSDRAAIGNLLYDALRRRRSLAAQMDADSPRAVVLAAAPRALGLSVVALAESAYDCARRLLAPGGSFVCKVLQGGAQGDLLAGLKQAFATVRHVKPPASRADSAELYLVATGFRGRPAD